MNIYRCLICGTPFLAGAKPTHCPFCGVRQRHLVPAEEYKIVAIGELSEKSRENLQRVLELEVENSTFYLGASKVADTVAGDALLRALARLEAEHVSIVARILDIPRPEELFEPGESSPSHKQNLAESRKREERMVHLYRRFLEEAVEDRVKQVLEAFIEIETEHLALSEEEPNA